MKVSIYTGKGASLAKDVMTALRKLNIPFQKVNEKDIFQDKLGNFSIFIVPGGWPEKYVYSLITKGYDKIRKFVKNGGKYIGICAGAYLASKKFRTDNGIFIGLELINPTAEMEIKKVLPGRMREIKLSKHMLSNGCPHKMKIWYMNGPVFKANKKIRVIAKYENNNTAIVSSKHGKGDVILFSPHPEGNSESKINPKKYGTIKLLKNALVQL